MYLWLEREVVNMRFILISESYHLAAVVFLIALTSRKSAFAAFKCMRSEDVYTQVALQCTNSLEKAMSFGLNDVFA